MTVDPLAWVAQVWNFDLLGSFSPASVSSNPALLLVSQCPPENLSDFHSSPGPHSSSQNGYCTNYQESNGSVCESREIHNRFQVSHSFSTFWCMGFLLKSFLVKHVMSDLARTEVSPHATSVDCISCLAILTRAGLCFDTASCDTLLEMLQPQHSWCFWP